MSKQRALRLKAWLLTLCMVISLVPTAAFAAEGKTLNYVSLGDSMSNGYGLTNYNENTSGYEGYGDGAYPAVFFEGYLKDLGYTHKAMAMSAMRAEDLHFLLDFPVGNANAISVADGAGFNEATWEATFGAGDKYTHDNFTAPGGRLWRGNAGTNEMAKAYQNAVKNADLISLGIGNANFGVFLMENITNAFGVFGGEKADSDWMKTALNGCDDAMKEKLQTLMDKLSASLSAKLASLGDAAEPMVDAILYTVVSYLVNYAGVLEAIVGLNPDVEVILVGLMDTTNGMSVSFEVQGETRTLALSTVLSLLVEPINTYITTLPAVLQAKGTYKDATFYYAEAPSVQCLVDTFGVAIKENALIRERFHETIVGTESNPGFIWDMAGDMLGDNIPSVEGLTPALVYVSLKQVEDYEAALDSSDADFLQTKYIDPILKVMDDGELTDAEKDAAKTAANAAMNELLSLAFYLSIEAAALEASNAQWGHLDTAALTALVNGNLASVFEPVLGVVKDPGDEFKAILEKNDQMIYDLIAAVASNLAKDALDAEVELTAQHVQDILSGEEDKINEVFFELAAEMVKTMTEENFDGIGKVNLSTLGIDKDAVREIYNETEAGYTKLYEMAAKIVSDMDKLNVDGIGEIDPGKLGITADDIKAIYKVANGIKTEVIDGETVDYEKNANEFYYRMVETLASDLGYDGLTAEDAASIIDPNYEGGLTAHVFAVAQEKYAEEPFEFEVDGKTETFKLSELGLSADGKDLKAVYEYALTPSDKAKEAAADEVFYKIATVVANKTVFKDVDENEQPKEDVIKELITVEDGNYSLAVFKLAMDLAGNQVVYTIKDANNVDKNITLDQLNLSADGKDLKALYDYARNPVDTNPNKAAAYGVYYKMIALVAPEMGFGGLEADDIESVIDETKMPTKAVFEFALTEAGSEVVYEGLTLNQLGVNANDLMALYYFAKGETTVTIDGVEVACEAAADTALYKIAAVVANNDPEYKDLGLLDTHIKSIVEDTVPSAAVFTVALKIAKDEEVYNKNNVVVKVSDLGLTGSELRAVYIDAKDGATTSVLAANTYNKIAAIVANKTTFAGVTDSNGEALNASDIAKILSGIYETKVFELALKVSGNKEVYRDGETVVTLGELNLSGEELKALYEYAKTKEATDAANAVLYKIAAAVANKTTFKNATGDKLNGNDIEKIINKQYDEKLFNLAIQVADKNKVVYTDGTGADAVKITLNDLNLTGAELKALYDYASENPTPAEMSAVVENILYDVAAKVANETTFKDAANKLEADDIANIIAENYTEDVFELAIQVVDPNTVVYSEGAAKIKLSDLELTGGDLLALYNYAKAGNPEATTDKVDTILYNIAAKVAKQTVFAGKNVTLDGALVAKIIAGNESGIYDPAVFALAVDVADGNTVVYSDGGKDITLSELGLTGPELQALYNYDKDASEANALAANAVFNKIAAAVANKTVFENATGAKLEAGDIAKIINKQYDEKLFNLAIQVVDPDTVVYSEGTGENAVSITLSELSLNGEKLKELYDYASANPTPEEMPEAVADVLYYIAAKVANKTVFNGKDDPVTPTIVGKIDAGTYDKDVFGLAFKVVPTDTVVYSGVTLGELGLDGAKLKALYDYAKAGKPNDTTPEVDAILYDIAAKVANQTTFAGKGNPVTPTIVGKIVANNYDESVFSLALTVAPVTTVVYSDEDVTVTLGDLSLDGAELKALYEYDKEPTVANEAAADDVLYELAAVALTKVYSEHDVTVSAGDVKNIGAGNDDGKKALYQIAAETLDTTSTDIETHVATNPYYAAAVNSVETTVKEKFQETKGGISSTENNKVVAAVDEQLGKVNTELNNAKVAITAQNSVIVTTVDTELNKVKTKLATAKGKITGDESVIVSTVNEKFGEVGTKLENAKTSIGAANNNPVKDAVDTQLNNVTTKLNSAKTTITAENSVIVSTVDNELGEVKTKFNAAKDAITGDNSEIVTTVDAEFGKVEAELNKARNSIVGDNSLVLSAVDTELGEVKTELDNAKKKFKETIVPDIDTELGKVKNKFTNAKDMVADPNEAFMTKVEEKFAEVRADFNEAVYGDENDPNDGANGEILAAVNENVGKVKDQFRKAKDMISGENSEIVSKVDSTLKDVRDNFASAQEKVSDLVKTGVDGARDKIKTSIDEAKELIKGYDLNNYFDLIRKLFAMDELVPEAAKESETLMSLLHLFSRMLIGNGLGAHPNTTGHAALAEAVKEAYVNKHTVQDELKQDIGVLMLGMGGLLVKFGTDILGIALDTDTIKGYLNDLPAAAEALMQALDEKFKDYETSKNTLNNAISALEAKLDVLTARLEKLSVMLEGKQEELSDAFKMAANANNKAADTAVKNLKAVVQDLATLITETRTAITTTKQMLTEAKTQLAALENAMVELKNAVATLKNGVDGMNALLTNVNTTIDKFVTAYKTASDTVMNGIDAVKVAYDKSEDALEKARGYAVKATNKAEEIYDGMYKTLADLYDALPADMALVLFGAVGGGAYVTLELTKATLVPYAEARIAEKQAELEAKAADLDAKIAEKKEALKNLSDNAAAKAQLEDEINKLETQLAALEDQINAEITDLRIGIEEANAGNLTKLKADYQKLIETITSGARSGIKDAMDDVAASAVKTTARLVTSTIEAISDAIRFVDAKIDQVVREAKNVYTEATGDEYTITENSLYVALGDSAAAAENSYVKLLAEATNEDKTTKIPFANLAVANQSVGEAVNHINNNKETIAAADLITVGYGNTTFGKMAVDRANAVVKGETPDAYDWKSVVGNEGAAYVKDTINSIKSSLIAAGLNKEGDNYAEAVAAAVEAYAYASVEYLVKLPSVINAIRDINDSAKIVIVGMYNPLNGLVLNHSADGATISLEMGDYLSKLVSGMNVYGTSYAMLATRTDAKAIFVEAPAAQVAPVDGDDNVMPMDAFLAWCADGVINVAPTANGQQYIADQILSALDITDQTENLTGTVTIEGELVYDEELTALYEGNATNVDYQWYRNGEPITGATEQTYTTTAADVGKTLTVKVIGTGKYKGDTTSVGKIIDKAEYPNAADLEVTAQYGQILAEVDLPDNWTWDPADLTDDVGAAGSTNTWDAVYTPTAAEATVDGVEVYGPVVKAVTVTVEKAPVTEEIYTAPKPLEHGLTENGQTLTLVEPGTIADGYGEQVKIMYLMTEDPDYDPTEDPDADWSEVVPTATEAGTYYVWYYVDGGNNYESTDPQCIVVTVAEALATLLGDVTLDGKVDANDLTALARHVAGIEELTKPQALRNGEVTCDGNVDANDLTHLARYVAQIISVL